MFTVTTRATDLSLLTLAELRSATGKSDGSADTSLLEIGKRISAMITRACRIAADGVIPPTLRKETITETFRTHGSIWSLNQRCHGHQIIKLSRRPIVTVSSVIECGNVLDETSYERNDGAALLQRLCNDRYSVWANGTITVVYDAGWDTVPDDLKIAAAKLAATLWSEGTRDPNLKSVEVTGISVREYWVPPTTDPAIPAEVMELLGPYRNTSFG